MNNFLTNKTPANWRNYSPGGKRKKITTIPFNGQVNNNIRAMGTKRIPVLSNKFNYSYMTVINFAQINTNDITDDINLQPIASVAPVTAPPLNRKIKYSYLTNQEKRALTPEQRDVLMRQEQDELNAVNKTNYRADSSNLRANYRTLLETGRETRGWLKTLGAGD